jgi:hypothetical protein
MGVSFIDASHGWTVGDKGLIFKTVDGGSNWTQPTSYALDVLSDVAFADSLHGWAVGGYDTSNVMYTNNGGETWSWQRTSTRARLYGVSAVDSLYAWTVAGKNGHILNTSNGGAAWTVQGKAPYQTLYDVCFVDKDNGWMVGEGGYVVRITNASTELSAIPGKGPAPAGAGVRGVRWYSMPGRNSVSLNILRPGLFSLALYTAQGALFGRVDKYFAAGTNLVSASDIVQGSGKITGSLLYLRITSGPDVLFQGKIAAF